MNELPRLPWSNLGKVSAEEILLLAGGPHLNTPTKQSWMTLGVKPPNGDLRDWNLAALPVHERTDYLPNFIESLLAAVLDVDSYNSLHCFYRAGSWNKEPVLTHRNELHHIKYPNGEILRQAYRKAEGVARLNCAYVDIDYYDKGLSPGNVIGQIYDLQNDGKIPPPTYLKDSGRGLWAVWLLGLEARSYSEHVRQWTAIQTKLHCMFAAQGSDSNVHDAARLTRIVGSVNTNVDRRANMVIFAKDTKGEPIRYRLDELADALNCKIQKRFKKTDPLLKLSKSAKSVKGIVARWKFDEQRFWTLVETIRKIVPEGTRNAHSRIIGAILKHRHENANILEAEIYAAADRLYRRMERSKKRSEDYTLEKTIKEIRAGTKKRKNFNIIGAKAIANALKLTTFEAEQLRDLVPTASGGCWPPAEGQPNMAPVHDRKYRKSVILDWMRSQGYENQPSAPQLAEIIAEKLAMKVSPKTICEYRKELKPPQPPPGHTQGKLPLAD